MSFFNVAKLKMKIFWVLIYVFLKYFETYQKIRNGISIEIIALNSKIEQFDKIKMNLQCKSRNKMGTWTSQEGGGVLEKEIVY